MKEIIRAVIKGNAVPAEQRGMGKVSNHVITAIIVVAYVVAEGVRMLMKHDWGLWWGAVGVGVVLFLVCEAVLYMVREPGAPAPARKASGWRVVLAGVVAVVWVAAWVWWGW
ncbi:hypothetical protein [Bifidobacterium cuniculi]|uniref:Uncharacterized protein n=1 Tax=Bifidobacterium cuniculi TaxID=1688 RepID=A0A087AWP9_9BIFI|nr:hypothetical protein [Bifidobacterium cuniculi]KFI63199.1 hypothetical protein BCUN_1125 [Bifidobacterium cuniculi]